MTEIFDRFEVNRESIWPVLGKLLGGSVVLHLIAIAIIVFFPPVRDALNVAALFSQGGVYSRPYAHTQIDDSSTQLLTMTTEKFRYPDGYWLVEQGLPLPEAIPTPTPGVLVTMPVPKVRTPRLPRPRFPVPGPSPGDSPAVASNDVKPSASPTPQASPSPGAADAKPDEKALQELAKQAQDVGIDMPKEGDVNKKPFQDLAILATSLKNEGKLNIDQPFEVVIKAGLDEHGKLVDPKVDQKAGDPQLTDLSMKLVAAMNDSGVLYYLKALNKDNPNSTVVFTIKQEKDAVTAKVESEAASDLSARDLVKGFKFAIAYGVGNRKGKPEEQLLKNTDASADGKKIIFSFNMPKQNVVDIIKNGIVADAQPTGTPS